MGLIDDNCIIGAQPPVVLGFSQQDTVGHDFYIGVPHGAILEADFIPDSPGIVGSKLFGNASRDCGGGNSSRLGAADDAIKAPAGGQTVLWQLGGLARSGLPGYHHNLVLLDGGDDFVFSGKNRQGFIKARRWHVFPTPGFSPGGCLQAFLQSLKTLGKLWIPSGFVLGALHALEFTQGRQPVACHGLLQIGVYFFFYARGIFQFCDLEPDCN